MSNADQPSNDAAPYVQLFQKAHQKIVLLERLDEQLNQLLTKRQEMQDELRALQTQINDEFDSRLRGDRAAADSLPSRQVSVTMGDAARRNGGSPRFAATTIETAADAR